MTIPEPEAQKLDPTLAQRLRDALPGERLTVVLGIHPGHDLSVAVYRKNYASHQEFVAAQGRRRERLGHCTGPTLEALTVLGLETFGGKSAAYAVVTGPAAAIVAALALPGVRHATQEEPPPESREAL